MHKYRRISLIFEAERVTIYNLGQVAEWCQGKHVGLKLLAEDQEIRVNTNHGEATAQVGDWIIKNHLGEFYPCDNKTFSENYEEVVVPVKEEPIDKLVRLHKGYNG